MEPWSADQQQETSGDINNSHQVDQARRLRLGVLLVASHSVLLGLFIFLFTDTFYGFFFAAEVENFFFVRQSGLFLLCLGLFYFLPFLDLQRYYPLVVVIFLTKAFAVIFLGVHAQHAPRSWVIVLAAMIDGTMAAGLSWLFIKYQRAHSNNP